MDYLVSGVRRAAGHGTDPTRAFDCLMRRQRWHYDHVTYNASALTAESVLASAANAIVAVDSDLRVVVWNPAAERMFGWRAEDVVADHPPIVPQELMAEYHAVLERVREGGPLSIVTKRLHRDGRRLDVRVDASSVPGADGGVHGWVCAFRSYDSKSDEVQSAERARLVRRLTDVVADINGDLDLSTVLNRITHSLTELTGADAGGFVLIEDDKLRLASITRLSERLLDFSSKLDESLFGELLRSGKTVLLANSDTRSLDDLIWTDLRGLHTIALGVSNVQGRPYGALYALYSKRKVGHLELELLELLAAHAGVALGNAMAYQEIVRQRAHETAVVEASADGIAVLDRAGNVRKWNRAAAELTGLDTAEVVGAPPPFPLPEGPREPISHRLANGRWLEILVADIPATDESVVDFRDVTQAKALEEEKDLFLATTSHELRTPITVVKGFANTLTQKWGRLSEEARLDAVTIIEERSTSLSHLVESLLVGSRAGEDDLDLSAVPFDLGRRLHDAVTAFGVLSDHHELVLDLPDPLPYALGDPPSVDVIMGQLLENALKYSPGGGRIAVRAETGETTVTVTVEDDGVGIRPGEEERVFERFVQGEVGDRRRFGGLGLGLFIVRRLARAQNGDITARAKEPEGTAMRFTLPRLPEGDAAEPGAR
ncbi:PAS domain S-box-containing protein [Murinocardiopsis flavida]|uniref:Sensor-like histidine kinase SenX3 n=1 Tax=Murinocardiopsis flavida TaxID=645275 RepID=A0A2P8DQ72_9ACTN|nr:PAS domain S-box-containing protein [Murinocardiopsis flavida]